MNPLLRFTATAVLLLTAVTTTLAVTTTPAGAEEPDHPLNTRETPDDYKYQQPLLIPVDPTKAPQLYYMKEVDDTEGAPPIKKEDLVKKATFAKPGDSLTIGSWVFPEYIFQKRVESSHWINAPSPKELWASLNSADDARFLKTLTQIIAVRDVAHTANEKVTAAIQGAEEDAQIFDTPFVAVTGIGVQKNGESEYSQDPGLEKIQYFVRASDILKGKAKLNLAKRKLEVLQGFVIYTFKFLDTQVRDRDSIPTPRYNRLSNYINDFMNGCGPGGCILSDKSRLGTLMHDTSLIFLKSRDDFFDDASYSMLTERKQECMLIKIYKECGNKSAIAELRSSLEPGVDCDAPGTLLIGLKKVEM